MAKLSFPPADDLVIFAQQLVYECRFTRRTTHDSIGNEFVTKRFKLARNKRDWARVTDHPDHLK